MNPAVSRDLGRLFFEANATPDERDTIIAAVESPAGDVTDAGLLPPPARAVVAALRARANGAGRR